MSELNKAEDTVVTLTEVSDGKEFVDFLQDVHFSLFTKDLPGHHREHACLNDLEHELKGDIGLIAGDTEILSNPHTANWLDQLIQSVSGAGYVLLAGIQKVQRPFPDCRLLHVHVVTNRSPALQFSPKLKKRVRLAIYDEKQVEPTIRW